jgi:glycine dehydrogenase subunit 1
VVKTYLRGTRAATVVGDEDATTNLDRLMILLDQDTAAVVVQNPNFFGQCEMVETIADAVHRAGALFIVVTDPISLGMFEPPVPMGRISSSPKVSHWVFRLIRRTASR